MRTFYAFCLVVLALAAQPAQAQFYGYSSYYHYPQTRVYYAPAYTWPTYYYGAYSTWPTYYSSPYVYQSYYAAPSYYVAPTVVTAPVVTTPPTVVAQATVVPPPTIARSYYYSPDTPSTVTISIFHNVFSSSTMTVQAGSTVRWVNQSERTHTVTSNDNRWFSGNIPPGGSYEAVFQHPGTYHYHCQHHPGMTGTIVVR